MRAFKFEAIRKDGAPPAAKMSDARSGTDFRPFKADRCLCQALGTAALDQLCDRRRLKIRHPANHHYSHVPIIAIDVDMEISTKVGEIGIVENGEQA